MIYLAHQICPGQTSLSDIEPLGKIGILSCNVEEFSAPVSFLTIKSYKSNVKCALLRTQNEGNSLNWQNDNFPLYNISGLRKSCITRHLAE